jgi:RNA polymerase sigma-70 factor (sigma-E family)
VDAQSEREFREFVTARSHALFRVAYALTGQQQSAEDLVQVALTRTAGRWRRIRGAPEAYARKIVYHEHASWWRRRSSRELPVGAVPERAVTDGTGTAVRRLALQQALRRLAPRQRAVLVLRFLEDLSERDVATALGCSPSTVGSQTSRALARLRELAPELRDLLDWEEITT